MKFSLSRKAQPEGPHSLEILSLLFGSLLGDSYAEKRGISTRFHLQQEESNMEYLFWFHNFLASRGYCSPKRPKLQKRIGKGNKVRFYSRIRTYSFSSLTWIYGLFYPTELSNSWTKVGLPLEEKVQAKATPEGLRKRVPREIGTFLTPLALAVWIMDNGCRAGSGLKLSTNGFPKKDVEFLASVLKNKYSIQSSVHCSDNQYTLYIWKKSMNIVRLLVKPYLVSSMWRKVGESVF